MDCTAFLLAAVDAAARKRGVTLTRATRKQLAIANLTKSEAARLDALVEAGHRKIRGVRTALLDAGLGVAVDPKDARPGDLVQYWYRTSRGWRGHAAIVERIDGGVATLYGSHKTTLQSERKLPLAKRRGESGAVPASTCATGSGRSTWFAGPGRSRRNPVAEAPATARGRSSRPRVSGPAGLGLRPLCLKRASTRGRTRKDSKGPVSSPPLEADTTPPPRESTTHARYVFLFLLTGAVSAQGDPWICAQRILPPRPAPRTSSSSRTSWI